MKKKNLTCALMIALVSAAFTLASCDDSESIDWKTLSLTTKSATLAKGQTIAVGIKGGTSPYTYSTTSHKIAIGKALTNKTDTVAIEAVGDSLGTAEITIFDSNHRRASLVVTVQCNCP